ncbi:hypothetical protein Hanom_Chr04g00291721 [Helianthus anomalus]
MKHLPENLLPSLLSLNIAECRKLEGRCSRRGSYLSRISHIPCIRRNTESFYSLMFRKDCHGDDFILHSGGVTVCRTPFGQMPALINWLYLEMLSEFCITSNLNHEKNELREEELVLKAEKANMEQQVKSVTPHPAACQELIYHK